MSGRPGDTELYEKFIGELQDKRSPELDCLSVFKEVRDIESLPLLDGKSLDRPFTDLYHADGSLSGWSVRMER